MHPPPQISSAFLLPNLPPRYSPPPAPSEFLFPASATVRDTAIRGPLRQCCCFAQKRSPHFLAHAPLHSLTRPPSVPTWSSAAGGGTVEGRNVCMQQFPGDRTGYPTPLQTYIHKQQPTHALTETATNLTPPPQHTLTQTYTQILTQKRSQTPTQTRTPRRTRTATQPDPGRLVTDPNLRLHTQRHTRRCARRGQTRHTPRSTETRMLGDRHRVSSGAAGDSRPRFQTKPTGSLRPLRGSEPPPASHLWRRPLPHSPSWERLAPPGAQQQARAGQGRGGREPHRAWPAPGRGLLAKAWVPEAGLGRGRRRH